MNLNKTLKQLSLQLCAIGLVEELGALDDDRVDVGNGSSKQCCRGCGECDLHIDIRMLYNAISTRETTMLGRRAW
jgi:hypothetical protein